MDFLANIQWREATWLWLAWVPVVLAMGAFLRRNKQQSQYADKVLWAWVKVAEVTSAEQGLDGKRSFGGQFVSKLWRWLFQPTWLLGLAWIALVVALAGPRTPLTLPEGQKRPGIDILMVLDLSRSMSVQDVQPNRLAFAKTLIESTINRLQPNDRVGLMVYAGEPHLVMPLTFDRHLLAHYLGLIKLGLLPTRGSLIKPAIALGVTHLQQTAGQAKVMMVWTNGEPEEFSPQPLPKNWENLAKAPVRKIVIGVGKTAKSKIPDPSHASGYLHLSGILAFSRLEVLSLRKLAKQINGQYLTADASATFIQRLIQTATQGLTSQERQQAGSRTVYTSYDGIFTLISVLLLMLAFYRIQLQSSRRLLTAPMVLMGLMGVGLMTHSKSSFAEALSPQQTAQLAAKAFKAFQAQEYDTAQGDYETLNNYDGWLGAGAAAYRLKDYETAVFNFRQAAWAGKTDAQRRIALFNLGNAFYSANLLPQAIESYQQALKYEPNNVKTQHNLALAKKRLAKEAKEKGKNMKKKKGDGKGSGSQSQNADGAMYGGQKPNPDKAGKGVSGDASQGDKQGRHFVLPTQQDRTDFSLNRNPSLNQVSNASGNKILAKLAQQQQIESFEKSMQSIQDKQQILLKRLFEREEGYQADQTEPHALPGVKPW